MLLVVGFLLLTFVGSGVSGHRPRRYSEPSCPKNEHYTRNNAECIRTCANKWVPHSDDCKPFTGCVCDKGLVRLNDDASGKCVPESQCPNKCKDRNAVYKDTLSPCPLTCAYPKPRPCPLAAIKKGGCECIPDFVLDEANKKCVRPKDCPGNKCKDPNAVNVDCPNPCPLSCDRPFPGVCTKACVKSGCQCASGYILNNKNIKYGKCVRPKDCPEPIRCPKHSQYVIEDNQCQKTCGNRLLPYSDVAGACVPFTGCSCKSGYVKLYDNATGPCIPENKCPPIPTQCGENEVATSCRISCPPQNCDTDRVYDCPEPICEPGCDCKNDYLRNKDGICILSKDCPKPEQCGENEVASDCAIQCPPQACESMFTTYLCSEPTCTAGCNCIDGYLRNSLKKCVPSEECYNDPAGCGGDVNATRTRGCNSPTQPSCNNPDPKIRSDICQLNGCECKTGYIRSEDGNCIEPKDCPGGSPNCGTNQTYVGCKFGCPTNYCPADDSRAIVACSPPFICQAGCACMGGYLIESRDNPQCVLASDCPEFKCTRPNEVFDRSPSKCFSERCEDRGSECSSPYPPGPRCVCEDGYYRNETDTCVHVSECPPFACKDDLNATYTDCPSYCPISCDNIGQEQKPCIAACAPAGCVCNPGYILNKDGKCIYPEDCPVTNAGCRGDPNAVYKGCPSACEPTCAKPDRNQPCTRQCLPPGCVCKPDFVLNEKTGKCVKPNTCPAVGCNGDPNATYFNCTSYCPPSCADIGQEPKICIALCGPPGCQCNSGYVLDKDGKCVKPEDCPVVGCNGDRNATYTDCTSSCAPSCADIGQEPRGCAAVCGPGGCQCNSGYVLDKDGKCIKPEDCPVQGCGGDPNGVYKECISACEPTCTNPDPQICTLQCLPSGCACKEGYVKNEETGKCVKRESCPAVGCNGDPNATYFNCTSSCPPSCDDIGQEPTICIALCGPPGCQCNSGYVLDKDGKCVKPKDCPVVEKGCGGDLNATPADCPSSCPPTCADRNSKVKTICPAVCDPSGCVCKKGYILIKKGGKCVKPGDCPAPGCKGDSNAVFSDCPTACEPTCSYPKPQRCTKQCKTPGCVCKPDFVLNEKTGKCVKLKSCPVVGCKGDRNATYTECTSYCPPSCADIDEAPRACIALCGPGGCACNPGYLLNPDGKCIDPKDCPVLGCGGDPNAKYKDCPSACEPSCLNPKPQVCTEQCLPPSCVCKPDFVLNNETGKCVKVESCPVIGCGGDPNGVYKECISACEPTCTNPDPQICTLQCLPSGCACKEGYVKNEETGKCVKRETCPVDVGCQGDRNATHSDCSNACPPICGYQYSKEEKVNCANVCDLNICECKQGYMLTERRGICVKPEDCPECKGDPNAVFSNCPSACEPNCNNPKPQICTKQCMSPGCVCKSDFVLNEKTGKCVKPDTCPEKGCKGDPNAMYSECPSACEPTCLKPDPNQPCTYQCLPPGCVCMPGFVRNEKTGKCINPETCPAEPQCKGDRNATYTKSPEYCQPTCKDPEPQGCMDMRMPPACICKQGYIFNKKGGRCIRPTDCPGGLPKCRANETYVYCNAGCPTDYCPVDDSRAIIACDPPYPCLGGCACKSGYLIASENDDRCISRSECPQLECTRKNEIWDPNALGCLRERCDDRGIPCDYQYPGPPRCVCRPGYYRNENDACIPECQCPKPGCNGDLNATFSNCPSRCPATCGDSPDQICTADCAEPGCVCNDGFVRSEPGGVCIRREDCGPSKPVCGKNEIAKDCRRICPPQTCISKYALFLCVEDIPCKPGCDCIPNYLRNDKGICIPSEQCPPLEPEPTCGYNEVSVPCRQICPPQNCEIAYTEYACTEESKICEPGCDCLPDHLRNGSGICIPNEKCPYPSTPVCGINEIARDCKQICPPQSCQSKYIEYSCLQYIACKPGCDCVFGYLRNDKGICIPSHKCPPLKPICGYNEVSVPCRQICPPQNCDIAYTDYACTKESEICEPGCNCLPDHLRNGSGICIPNDQCPGPCQVTDECKRTCASPNPPDCAYNPPEENINGCDCKEGYILSEKGGDCIPIENCPPETACNGDPNAVAKRCPKPCPSTCDSPNQTPCKRACEPLACACKPGYLLSNATGLCILPDKCSSGNPCGKNGQFVDCKNDCPYNYCPVDDSRALIFCDPPAGLCLSGCVCGLNSKRKSREHPKCITSSDCPPVNCTRPNEVWDSCPSACLAENCEDIPYQPVTCNTLVLNCEPRCVCKKKHFRNSDGICIPARKCPVPQCEDVNAVYKSCVSACEPTCASPTYEVCTDECRPGRCVCKDGFVLNENDGKCVTLEQCPVPVCEDVNAVYKSCVSACEPTCASPTHQICSDECRPGRCVCKDGFVLNQNNGKCVKPRHCPAC